MFNLIYSLKIMLKKKTLVFWTIAFPLILATMFNLAFSDIENNEKLDIINIAVVKNDDFVKNDVFKESIKILSEEGEDRLFSTKYTSLKEAKNLLKDKEISGYVMLKGEKPVITINSNGINETVLKFAVDEIMQQKEMLTDVIDKEVENMIKNGEFNIDAQKLKDDTIDSLNEEETNIKDTSNKNLSYTMIEFYTLIAMACLYGGILSMEAINQNMPNLSDTGKRVFVGPTKKGKFLITSLIASYIIQLTGLILLFSYTVFILKVDYGSNLPLIILLSLVGSFAGLSLGIMVGSAFKSNENTKTGILIALTMLGCFLSGMMGITMKYIIDTNVAIVNKLNPANMITDGFYSLYYYDTLDRFWLNIISLIVFSFIMLIISFFKLRRQKYDSL